MLIDMPIAAWILKNRVGADAEPLRFFYP